jgi:hypothetical protein
MSERVFPIEECMAYDEFTDCVELLRELETWIKNVRYKRSGSTSIISPRRLGKTVLLERLVNIVFFKPEYKVAPILWADDLVSGMSNPFPSLMVSHCYIISFVFIVRI